jgi:hypothetical protein
MGNARYNTYMGHGPARIEHWEHWSNPDAETYITGIDYYDHPRSCRLKLKEMYPFLTVTIPDSDDPRPRPGETHDGDTSWVDDEGQHHVRWGESETGSWDYGKLFPTPESCLEYSPLEHLDMTGMPWVEAHDFSSDEAMYRQYGQPGEPTPGEDSFTGTYNTMFMWPLLVFGWMNFLEICLLPEFERVMAEFAELNRRLFRVFAKLPVNFVLCHDDICNTRGLVCSPKWMNKYIYPAYEEQWSILRDAGKDVIFMTDGNPDPIVADIMACGAKGIISEPYGDYKRIARDYDNPFIAGEGDNRILHDNNPAEIRAMVESMVETSKMSGGYMMCVGNHIPWNVTPEGVKLYLDLSQELAYRE